MELAGVVWEAATCLFRCGKEHAAYVYKLEENLSSLQDECNHLQIIISDVQMRINEAERTGEEQRASEVKDWLQQVENLQKELVDIQNKGFEETENKCLKGCCPKNCLSTYKLGKKVVKMPNEVDELTANGRRFPDKNVLIAWMPLDETVGLDLLLNKVWSCLEDESVSMVGLYGMGGVGKTTLLKRIHNEFGKRKHDFEIVLWVVVSKDVNINKIMDDIGNRISLKTGNWNKISPDRRATKIHGVLKKKKYVLMLDDLWKKLDLNKVGVPHPNDCKYQSKILFTTRFQDVCDKMQARMKFEVKCLSEQEAFNLFCKKVGEETLKCNEEISNLAWKITEKCNGLPLALVTLGSRMARVTNIESWMKAESSLWSCPDIAFDMEKDVFLILKLSYDWLPDETYKKCFLYCSLYPKDYEIDDDVIYRWIGEGFLGDYKTKKRTSDMYVQGKFIIEKLKLSYLLEEVIDHCYSPHFMMNDASREMALRLFRDEDGNKDKVVVEGEVLALTSEMDSERLNVVERISIINLGDMWWEVPACPNLITLTARFDKITNYSNLQCMTKLKVLDLSYTRIGHLPVEIGKLISLEFLNLSETEIQNRLPIELKNLKNLRVLLMEEVEFNLDIFPLEVIESLERLKVFRFSSVMYRRLKYYKEEERFVEKLESLIELEELCMELTTIPGMRKYLQSTKLQSCSTYCFLCRMSDSLEMTSILESLSAMKYLRFLRLYRLQDIKESSSVTNTCHLDNLHKVDITFCNSMTHLTWLRYAPLLQYLSLRQCDSIEEVVKEDGGSDRDDANYIAIFEKFTHLQLKFLPNLKSIHKKALSFVSLKYILVDECPNLRKLPLNFNSAKDTLIQIKGEKEWWNNLEWEDPTFEDQFYPKFRV